MQSSNDYYSFCFYHLAVITSMIKRLAHSRGNLAIPQSLNSTIVIFTTFERLIMMAGRKFATGDENRLNVIIDDDDAQETM